MLFSRAQRRKQLQQFREEEEGLSSKKPKLESFEDIQFHGDKDKDNEEGDASEGKFNTIYLFHPISYNMLFCQCLLLIG